MAREWQRPTIRPPDPTVIEKDSHGQTIKVVLVALSDGVEPEIWADGSLRRRSRFLRDSEARKYSDRLSARLTRRGYHNQPEFH